jgi:hypothetical protein
MTETRTQNTTPKNGLVDVRRVELSRQTLKAHKDAWEMDEYENRGEQLEGF